MPQPDDEHLTTMRSAFDRTKSNRHFDVVRGLFHLNLTDYPLVSPLLSTIGATGPIVPTEPATSSTPTRSQASTAPQRRLESA